MAFTCGPEIGSERERGKPSGVEEGGGGVPSILTPMVSKPMEGTLLQAPQPRPAAARNYTHICNWMEGGGL